MYLFSKEGPPFLSLSLSVPFLLWVIYTEPNALLTLFVRNPVRLTQKLLQPNYAFSYKYTHFVSWHKQLLRSVLADLLIYI